MLSERELLQEACRRAGLDDYGNMSFSEGLAVLVASINNEAGLDEANEARTREELLRLLVNRLRMRHDVKRHPEIGDEEILPPVFITSLPRTGSTKLHRLLAASQDFYAMTFWQAYNFAPFPAPFTKVVPAAPDPRIAVARRHLDWMRERSPLYLDCHPLYAEEIDEETILLDVGFNNLYQHAAILNVPGYVEWVLTRDPRESFRDVRGILQYMQWQHFGGRRRRWLLKTPSLLGCEDALADVYPGMDFIVTHRHPEKILPSVCALFCGIRKLYYDDDVSASAGPIMMYNFGETVQKHLQWRDTYPAERVMDVRFEEIAQDEIALLHRIYDFLDMPLSDEAIGKMQGWLAMDAARHPAPRKFALADYGLDPDVIGERFSGYIARYEKYL